MAEKTYTYESRRKLVEKHEQAFILKTLLASDEAKELAKAFVGSSVDSRNYIQEACYTLEAGECPSSFVKRSAFKELLSICIPNKKNQEKYLSIIDKSNLFQYSQGYYRRSVRSKNYAFGIVKNIYLLYDFYKFSFYGCSLSQYLKNELSDEYLDLKKSSTAYSYKMLHIDNEDLLIAAELDQDLKKNEKGELHKTIEDIILGDSNTSSVTVPLIRGILKSDDKALHALLGKFLLAARLQEGVRQAICENMDCGTIQAFETLFNVIKENNLIRFSSVKRAVATWIGILNQEALERISKKTLALMDEALHDKNRCDQMLSSEDSMELIVALWSKGFLDAESALTEITRILSSGSKNQLLVVAYYNSSLYNRGFYSKVAEFALENYSDDLELVAAFLPTYLNDYRDFSNYYFYKNFPDNVSDTFKTHPEKWFEGNAEKAKVHTDILLKIYKSLGKAKKAKTFSPCTFPWYSVSISKSEIASRLLVLETSFPGILSKEDSYEMLENSDVGNLFFKEIIRVRINHRDKNFAVKAMANKKLMKVSHELLQEVSLKQEDYIYLESLLHYKDDEQRKLVSDLIAEQGESGFADSIKRLLKAKTEGERFAALNFISGLKNRDIKPDYKSFEKVVNEIPHPSEKEKLLIKTIFPYADKNDEDNDLPKVPQRIEEFYDISKVEYFSASDLKMDTNELDNLCKVDNKKLKNIIAEFDSLVIAHKNDQYKGYNGEDRLLGEKGSYVYDFGHLESGPITSREKILEILPFAKLWTGFYEEYVKDPVTLLQLYLLSCLPKLETKGIGSIMKKFVPSAATASKEEPGEAELKKLVRAVFAGLCDVNPGEYEYFSPAARWSVFKDVFEALVFCYCSDDYLLKIRKQICYKIIQNTKEADLWFCYPARYYRSEQMECVLANFSRNVTNIFHFYILTKNLREVSELTDSDFTDYFKLYYTLACHADFAGHTEDRQYYGDYKKLYPEDFFRAYKLGIINKDTMYFGIIKVAGMESSMGDSTFYNSENPELFEIYKELHDAIVVNEIQSGEGGSYFSKYVNFVKFVYGSRFTLLLIQALGKTPFERNGYSNSGRTHNLSHLISESHPAKDDSVQEFKELVKKYKVSEQKLFDLAMYNPEWIPFLSKVLDIPSLESGCYYFIAHMKAGWNDHRDATKIARYTPLSIEDLSRGAFDLDWFTEVFADLGEETFDKLYLSAKYISDGSQHSRARKFADAALGRVTEEELEKEIERARNKDLVMSYPLIPFEKVSQKETDERILHRYEFLQKFKKESKQFGAQRRQSESVAMEIALENLSRSAGFTDVNRLNLKMEGLLMNQVNQVFNWQKLEAGPYCYEVRIAVDEKGMPSIECRKEGSEKNLKSLPAACKKTDAAEYCQEIYKKLKLQHGRTRGMFEDFMTEKVSLPAKEIANLLENPIVSSIVKNLIFITEDRAEGFLFQEDSVYFLKNFEGVSKKIDEEQQIRVAHAYDFFIDGHWHDWQKYIFDQKIVQPFKQVFRELYLKLDEEKDKNKSLMFAGNQIQPKKASAALKSRKWVCDYESGLEKIFYKHNLIATIYAQADWFSPADIECPALEYVEFSYRRYSPDTKELCIQNIDDILYSEVMRDVDLAVSVAHAGSVDPETSHSTIEMRRAVCEFTLPLFKISNVRFEKNFAFVVGSRAEYSVHLGTGIVHKSAGSLINIVTVHSQQRGKLFLPFVDEDPKTAEVLSKILLLARDESIKDPYILEQIEAVS